MRKRELLIGLLILVVGFAGSFLVHCHYRHRISLESYHQLRVGMTEQEVIGVLGGEAGDYGPGKGEIIEPLWFTISTMMIRADGKKWLAGNLAITVRFDESGRARGFITDKVYRPYDNDVEMIFQKLGLKEKNPYPPMSER